MAASGLNPVSPQVVVENYYGLVKSIARNIKRRVPAHIDVDDLVQTGIIGLLEASSRFDPTRPVNFASYANSRITGAILDELRKLDPCSRQDRKNARAIESAQTRLRASTGQEPSQEQIAQAVGMGLIEYDRTLRHLESAKPPSVPYNTESEGQGTETWDEISQLACKDESPFETCSKREDFKLLKSYIEQLPERQQQVLKMYYFKDMGLKAIAEKLGVGEARVCQIHKQALGEVRRMIESRKRVAAPSVSTRIQ